MCLLAVSWAPDLYYVFCCLRFHCVSRCVQTTIIDALAMVLIRCYFIYDFGMIVWSVQQEVFSTLHYVECRVYMLVVFCMKLCCGAQYVRNMVWLSNVWSVLFASIYVDAHLRWVWLNNSFFVSLSLRLNSKSFLITIYIYMYMYIYIIAISTDSLTICVNKTI